jgi:hypothetical protein
MTPQQAQAHIKEVDGLLNKRKAVPDEKKVLSLTALYAAQNWPSGAPLSGAAQAALALEDWGDDNRWNHHFQNNKQHLGLYRSKIGFYWVLICQGRELTLKHVGAPSDVIAQFGNKK